MAFTLTVATGVPTPIYKQIVDQVNLAVAGGSLEPGTRMPSVRAVAEDLLINPNTVARAYSDLVRDGVLGSQPGKGIFVAERRQRFSDAERSERLTWATQQFVREVAMLGYTQRELIEQIENALTHLDGAGSNSVELSVQPETAARGGIKTTGAAASRQEAKHP